MRSEALDITIESRGSSVLLVLAGPFHNEQVPNIREKITGLIDDGTKEIVVDLEGVTEINDGVVPMFLGQYNLMKGKHGEMKLIFRNAVVSTAFAPYRNIFSIHPDGRSLAINSIMHRIRRTQLEISQSKEGCCRGSQQPGQHGDGCQIKLNIQRWWIHPGQRST